MKKALLITVLTLFVLVTSAAAEDPPTVVWDKVFDSGNEDWGEDIAADAAGNVYVTGFFDNGTSYDWRTIKYNPDGDTLWTKTWDSGTDDDIARGIEVDDSGNVYLAGYIDNGTTCDMRMMKYDTDGNLTWEKTYDNSIDFAQSIAIDNSGNAYIAGWSYAADADFYIAKYDTQSNTPVWEKFLDTGVEETGYGIAVDDAGYIYVQGRYITGIVDNPDDFLTIKCDNTGDTLWTRIWDSGKGDGQGSNNIAVDNAGNVYVCGWCINDSITPTTDWCVISYDADGNLVWEKRIDSGYDEGAHCVTVDNDGFIYVTGDFAKASDWDYRTIKFDSDGTQIWEAIFDSGTGLNEGARSVTVDEAGFVYVTGQYYNGMDLDYLTIKYEQHTGIAEPSSDPSPPSFHLSLEVTGNLTTKPTIHYSLPAGQRGTLTFYSADGRKLESFQLDPAQTTFTWSTRNTPSGVHFAKLTVGNQSVSTKVMLTK